MMQRAFGRDLTNAAKLPVFDRGLNAKAEKEEKPEKLRSVFRLDGYRGEIFDALCGDTREARPDPLAHQPHLAPKNRRVLVEWLMEVHVKFKLSDESLFLAVSLLDGGLSLLRSLPKAKLQLLGVTALFVASKMEDSRPPEAKDFVYVTDKACDLKGLFAMELELLRAMDFRLGSPSAYRMMLMLLEDTAIVLQSKERYLAQYLLELTLGEYKFSMVSEMMLVCGAVYLMRRLHKMTPSWPENVQQSTGVTERQAKEVAKAIYAAVPSHESRNYCRVKYSRERVFEVALTL